MEPHVPPVPSTLSISKSSDDTLPSAGFLWFTENEEEKCQLVHRNVDYILSGLRSDFHFKVTSLRDTPIINHRQRGLP